MATDVKKQIAECFKRNAGKIGMDKVTINAIVSECGISRQAFYYYFQDIVDLARYVIRDSLEQTFRAGEKADTPREAVQIFAEDYISQFPVIALAVNSRLRGEMELLMIREMKLFFLNVFSRQECGRSLSRSQIDFQADFIACGVTAYAVEHCQDLHLDQKEFAEMLWDMLRRTYGEA